MTATAQRSPAEAFFAWSPAGVGAVSLPCAWCARSELVRVTENLFETLCGGCGNNLALGRARAIANEEGETSLLAHLVALGVLDEPALGGQGDPLDRLIDAGTLRRDLRLTLELDPEAGTHSYSAAPLKALVLAEEVERGLSERRRRGGVLSELLAQYVRARLGANARASGAEAGLERFEGGALRSDLLASRTQAALSALPLREEEGDLVVALWDPLDPNALSDLEQLSGRRVRAVLAGAEALRAALPQPAEGEAAEPTPDSGSGTLKRDLEKRDSAWEDSLLADPVDGILLEALEEGAEEFLIEPRSGSEAALRFRVAGELRGERRVPAEVAIACARELAPPSGVVSEGVVLREAAGIPLELSYRRVETPAGPSLAVCFAEPSGRGEGLGSLGLDLESLASFEEVLAAGRGLVVIGAPSAAERTSAYYAALERALRLGGAAVSLERRVRRVLPTTQVQVEASTPLSALASAPPDWLGLDGVGLEGADRGEALRLAIDTALAGKACLVTVPAVDAATALARLQLEGVPWELLRRLVSAVLARRRVTHLCPHCGFEVSGGWVGLGCAACAEQGRTGWLPIAELARPGVTPGSVEPFPGSVPLGERVEELARSGRSSRTARLSSLEGDWPNR